MIMNLIGLMKLNYQAFCMLRLGKENGIKMDAGDRVSIVMMAHEGRLLIPDHQDPLKDRLVQSIARTSFGKTLFKKLVLDKKRKKFNKNLIC